MKRISKNDSPLLKQFKRWAKSLLDINPAYVQEPELLQSYIKGPNWNDADPSLAHYKTTITLFGEELLGVFERMREGKIGENLDEYRGLLCRAGIDEVCHEGK